MNKVINKITRDDIKAFDVATANQVNALDYYQHISTKSAIYPGQGTPFGLMYAALGLAEAGEVQNKIKKAFRDDGVIEFLPVVDTVGNGHITVKVKEITQERRQQLIKELGGNLWYIAAVCNEIDATMSEVALANLEELCGRTERGTLGGSGDER